MMVRKKFFFLMGLLAMGSLLYADDNGGGINSWDDIRLNYELKVGVTPYERYGSKTYSERFDDGLDFGLEVYRPFEKYSLGFGGEVKRKLDDQFIREDGERLYAYYLLAKRKIGDTYSLVARLGKTSQEEFESSYYVAAGIEKRFGRVTVQLLGENTKLENNYNNKNYTTVGLKFGYIFGDISEPELKQPILENQDDKEVTTRTVGDNENTGVEDIKLIISGDEVTGGYEAYKTTIPVVQIENVKQMTTQLNEYDKAGTLEMRAYSDNTGSKELNVRLARERMDNLEEEFKTSGLTEKVRIEKIDPETTVKNIYKVENDSVENRKLNRRIEVTFFEDEEAEENDIQKNETNIEE